MKFFSDARARKRSAMFLMAWLCVWPLCSAAQDKPADDNTVVPNAICETCEPPPENVAPSVTLVTPTNGQTFIAGTVVNVTANASDYDGRILYVDLRVDGIKVGSDSTAPYSFNWTSTVGTHSIMVLAYDNAYEEVTDGVSITVNANRAPTASLTSPTSGQSFTTGAAVTMNATAADADANLARVDFYVDGAKVGQDTASPYSYAWTSTVGNHSLTAQAVDALNATGTSAAIPITVNKAPTASVTAPTSSQAFAAGSTINLTASATDTDGTIARVEFFIDNIKVGQDTTTPYAYAWASTVGSHSVKAVAYDNLNGLGTSTSIAFTVNPNVTPTVSLTAPASGQVFTTSTSIQFAAAASDPDGSIQRVEFLVDGVEVGEDVATPYAWTWSSTQGAHTISARTFDNLGASTVSAGIAITVNAPPTPPTNVTLTRRYIYDAQQRVCKIIDPETGATFIHYDAAGNVDWSASGLALSATTTCAADEATVLASGRVASRTYDARGRPAALTFPDNNGNQAWKYEKDGLPSQITTSNDGVSVINAYSYNHRRQLIGESIAQPGQPTTAIGYGYNANGHLATIQHPDGELINYAPNALGQPTQVSSGYAMYASNIAYFPNGALQQFTYGNGVVHTLVQNARQLPDRSRDVYGGTVVLDDSYDYDQVGNVAAISDAAQAGRGNRTMTYDGLDRLTAVDSPMFGADGARYAYDSVDNLISVIAPGRKHTYWYDAENHLTNVLNEVGQTVLGIGYDDQGNVSNKSGTNYGFDYGNRLRSVTYANNTKESYRYDGHGRRVFALTPNAPAGDILSQYDNAGVLRYQRDQRRGLLFNHIYLGGSLIAIRETLISAGTSSIKFQHTDALGTPVAVTDSGGVVLERSEYEPYGALLNRPLKDGPGFTGHVMDLQTGMVYMQQRYYDPLIGRFLSVDPVSISSSGGNFNRYWYSDNSPYTFKDPDGRRAKSQGSCGWCDYWVAGSPGRGDDSETAEPEPEPPQTGNTLLDRVFRNAVNDGPENELIQNLFFAPDSPLSIDVMLKNATYEKVLRNDDKIKGGPTVSATSGQVYAKLSYSSGIYRVGATVLKNGKIVDFTISIGGSVKLRNVEIGYSLNLKKLVPFAARELGKEFIESDGALMINFRKLLDRTSRDEKTNGL